MIRMIRSRLDRILHPCRQVLAEIAARRASAAELAQRRYCELREQVAIERDRVQRLHFISYVARLLMSSPFRFFGSNEEKKAMAMTMPVEITTTFGADQGCKIRSGRDRIIRIIAIGISSKFCQKSPKFCSNSVGIRQKSRNLTNSQHSLRNLAKVRENFIKIGGKFDENCEKYQNFENCKSFPTKIC